MKEREEADGRNRKERREGKKKKEVEKKRRSTQKVGKKMRVGVTSPQMLSAVSLPPPSFVNPRASRLCPSTLNVLSSPLQKLPKINFRFNCARDSGENESKTILDAFFLGESCGRSH
ncbi:Unknown protein [Striga hermonthica]|uniref:Uncharacterized protein n=1 Tax=Striga hermonthica TaxID=68872 RepID=A0A9N7R7L0_STRHE|nr:Unknown protein [Striga hermonthica]